MTEPLEQYIPKWKALQILEEEEKSLESQEEQRVRAQNIKCGEFFWVYPKDMPHQAKLFLRIKTQNIYHHASKRNVFFNAVCVSRHLYSGHPILVADTLSLADEEGLTVQQVEFTNLRENDHCGLKEWMWYLVDLTGEEKLSDYWPNISVL